MYIMVGQPTPKRTTPSPERRPYDQGLLTIWFPSVGPMTTHSKQH